MHEELKQVITQAMNTRFEFEQKLIHRAWEDEAFKQELISNPKAVYAKESGEEVPKELEIEVLQETAKKVYLVLPANPAPAITDEEELSEKALDAVAGGVSIDICIPPSLRVRTGEKCILWSKAHNAGKLA
ncbi:NHLP leader peptide family RiPP precursor [Scytonema sp. PCC 10023]|uniref:Nif11-type n=1 Tax=Scytonema sp. PCC 10023 TaxID=1680591 RepID=A0A2P0ZGW6_9CYAN|nr:Nif11-type precursor [Scytonema sp. PCC 10023]